jgi:ATP-dependent Clp protease ATP-binding subunit ClpB
LTEAVRRRPYAVILFDEIEKAHAEVFNLFLQVLDDGRLTDGQGRTVDFSNTVIIMTSNVGSQYIMQTSNMDVMREQVMAALRAQFRPEFLNRVDDIILFHRLEKGQLREIAAIQLAHVRALLQQRDITLELTDGAMDTLVEEGYDPVYGARPLKRAIQRHIVDLLAMHIVRGEIGEGKTAVVDVVDGEWVVR